MLEAGIRRAIEAVRARALPEGGFGDGQRGLYRPDASAWAILLLKVFNDDAEIVRSAQSRLTADQLDDGRVSVAAEHPQACWPTALACLAWSGAGHEQPRARAIGFLLSTTGRHWKTDAYSPFAHNPVLRGWPWIDGTHSWVEPTALAVLALRQANLGGHERVTEAINLLLDRQLPGGGWNYGNTKVFGRELRPAPESTGAALHAVSGQVAQGTIERSIDYLLREVPRLRSPIALGWTLLGLHAWEVRPDDAERLVMDCERRQRRYGSYDTAALSLLFLPLVARRPLWAAHTPAS